MKIKKIKDIDNIKIKLSHLELIVIKKALETSETKNYNINKFNDLVFDKDEIKSNEDVIELNKNMQLEISNKLKNILPY
jgi:phenolic acid decarboxylase